MVNYSLGKVYKIEPINGGEEGDVYVGSTSLKLLSMRLSNHRATYRRWKEGKTKNVSSYELFEKYGVDNCHIILLESVNASNNDELFARERHWIQTIKCVNKVVVGRTEKEWYHDIKGTPAGDRYRECAKKSRDARKENKKQYDKKYRDACKEKTVQYQKEYRNNNPRFQIQCECGGNFMSHFKSRHLQTKKHQQYCESFR